MTQKPSYEELENRVRELERTLAEQRAAQDRPNTKGGGNAFDESEGKYRLMVENANEAILVARDGVFVFSNPKAEALFGYSGGELGSRPLTRFVHEADRKTVQERHEGRLAGDTSIPDIYSFRIIQKSGDIRWVNLKVAMFSWNDKPATLCFMADITKRKQAEEALRESEAVMRYIIRHDPNAIAVYDRELRYVAVSDRYLRDYGIAGREILGKHHYEVFPEMPERWKEVHRRVLRGAVEKNDDDGFRRPDGSFTYNRWECRPWYRADESIGGMITYTEVTTTRKLAEKALKGTLAEKEVLLREIHHRVKNNMQTIVGLLRMHARRNRDPHLKTVFDDCRDRVEAMSLVHEALYQSDDLSRIDFEAYLKKLCRNLAHAHDAQRKRITLTINAADVSLNMDQGVAVGMIIAELVSNAFKHAFPNDEGGAVSVHLDRTDGETVRLVASDTGKGLPADFDIHNPSSLGMRLVSGAVIRELGGTIDVERGNGTRFIIRFECENKH
jgi:PAS domain S-box-containing protein